MAGNPKLIDKLSSQLHPDGRRLLRAVISCAGHYNMRAYLVGGPIRDLILERPALDLDIAIEGDAVRLADAVAREARGAVVKTSEFGTAAIKAGPFVLDLTTTRAETYARPGALPSVRPSKIDDDLHRRDFTINAVALELVGPAAGRLLDPVGGVHDIHEGRVKVLHDRSFQDDPTRILRAIRYETRLGFKIEEGTLALLRRDQPHIHAVSGTRLRHEMSRIFEEEHANKALLRMEELGVVAAIHPCLRVTRPQARAVASLGPATARTQPAYWALLVWATPDDDITAVVTRLSVTRAQREAMLAVPRVRKLTAALTDNLRPSEADELLSPFPSQTVIALGAVDETAAGRWARRHHEMRPVSPQLRGDDLIKLGVPEGPAVGEILKQLRAAKLDGEVASRQDEEAFVRGQLAANRNISFV